MCIMYTFYIMDIMYTYYNLYYVYYYVYHVYYVNYVGKLVILMGTKLKFPGHSWGKKKLLEARSRQKLLVLRN